jgi:hypothetical protein
MDMPASRFSLMRLLIALSILLALVLGGALLFISLTASPPSKTINS